MHHRVPRLAASGLVLLAAVLGPLLTAAGAEGEARPAARPNILWIILDATRPDHLGCYGYDLPTSPTIDRLAADGVVFENAISQAPWTKASFGSFLTSRYPFQTGVTDWHGMMPDSVTTLQQALHDDGYQTGCVLNMIGKAGEYNLFKGFDEIDIIKKPDRAVRETTERSLSLIGKLHPPFFIMIHCYNVHAPYAPSEEYRSLFRRDPAGAPSPQDLYDGCIREADAQISKMLDLLADRELLDDTMVMITADHGEAFGEHGRSDHGWSLYDEEIKVPLILSYPARYPGGQRVMAQVRLVDVLPTVLDVVGLEAPAQCEGVSAMRLVKPAGAGRASADAGRRTFPPWVAYSSASMREEVLPSAALRTPRWKVMMEPATGVISAFDLAADPGESINLWPTDAAPIDSLLAMLRAVPGISPRGWRLAFTDDSRETTYEARVALTGEGHIVGARKEANSGTLTVDISPDSRSIRITAATQDLNLVLFDTVPPGAEVEVSVKAAGGGAPEVHTGVGGRHGTEEIFRAGGEGARGIPQAFAQSRKRRTAGAFLWWAPGEEMIPARTSTALSPEELKRLKSLGYIH